MVTSKSQTSRYITSISNGEESIYSDVTNEKGGDGKYLRPHELIEAGYAACLNITARMALESMNIKYDEVIVQVDLDRSNGEKAIFKYNVDFIGDIDENTKNIVLKKLIDCPVRKTLLGEIEFENENN